MPIPAGPTTDTSGRAARGRRVEQVLQQPHLVVAADERRLEGFAAAAPAALADDPQRAPGRDRGCLALEHLLAGGLERDRAADAAR